jgi:diguanylate cyclase (GGDEF)-like protein
MKNQNNKPKVLIADDSPAMREAVKNALQSDYEVIVAQNGLQVLELVATNPDIVCIVMDLMMPHLDGFKTTHVLKSNFSTYHLPIIILTSQVATEDMVLAVEMGADDYMKKPFDETELKARLIMNLRRAERDQNSNPLTKLPGNSIINRTILARINQSVAVLYADLDNFKAYNDKYGFNMGDKIIQRTADILAFSVKSYGNPSDFLGHIGGDDFVILSTPEKSEVISQNICQEFDKTVPKEFYNKEDLDRKKIVAYDRLGELREFPLVSITVAIVTNEKRELTSMPQIAQIAAELKHYAKTKPGGETGSSYLKDRRSK